ncbi:MAG: hypothetical protein AABN34_01070 [Acidobacteriota bacterium]
MQRRISVIPTIILSLTMASCEIDSSVTVDGKNPPSFRVSGSGGINFLRVVDVSECDASLLDCPIVWQIDPVGGQVSIADLPLVVYGEVPQGFHQTIPANDALAPALVEGKKYSVYTPTYNANGGGVRFTIRAGKSDELR